MTDLSAHPATPTPSRRRAVWLTAEFLFLFFAIPTCFYYGLVQANLILCLVVSGAICLTVLLRDPTFDRKQLWNGPAFKRALPGIAIRFVIGAALITAGLLYYEKERLFILIEQKPLLWAIIMLAYPLFSVYPQEIIFRAFLMHRYAPVFKSPAIAILASAAAFGYGHIILNGVAVIMTFIGGALFAYTYHRSRSLAAPSLEHALYGNFIFTIGLGQYFYIGTMGQ
ncbi:MAG: CPBP family intramembrane glutamic endopeptidase [Phycisphaerales bacterium]